MVILLGWAGCQDRHLAKYSALYSQKVSSLLMLSWHCRTAPGDAIPVLRCLYAARW